MSPDLFIAMGATELKRNHTKEHKERFIVLTGASPIEKVKFFALQLCVYGCFDFEVATPASLCHDGTGRL